MEPLNPQTSGAIAAHATKDGAESVATQGGPKVSAAASTTVATSVAPPAPPPVSTLPTAPVAAVNAPPKKSPAELAIDAKKRRFINKDNVELDGSSRYKRIYKSYDVEEGIEVAMHVIPIPQGVLRATLSHPIPAGTSDHSICARLQILAAAVTKDDDKDEATAQANAGGAAGAGATAAGENAGGSQHPNLIRVIDSWVEKEGGWVTASSTASSSATPTHVSSGTSSSEGAPVAQEDLDNSPPSTIGKASVVIITPMITAGTLQGYINRVPDIRFRVVRKWCRQILSALGHIHSRGGCHGDLRLSNTFINGENGNVLLGSFRTANATTVAAMMMDTVGTNMMVDEEIIKRAIRYAAPETIEVVSSGQTNATDEGTIMIPRIITEPPPAAEADIYAFGMCVLEMVTRKVPYSTSTSSEGGSGDNDGEPPSASDILLRIAQDKKQGVLPSELQDLDLRRAPEDDAISNAGIGEAEGVLWSRQEVRAVRDAICRCLEADPLDRPTVQELLESDFLIESAAEKEKRRREEAERRDREEKERARERFHPSAIIAAQQQKEKQSQEQAAAAAAAAAAAQAQAQPQPPQPAQQQPQHGYSATAPAAPAPLPQPSSSNNPTPEKVLQQRPSAGSNLSAAASGASSNNMSVNQQSLNAAAGKRLSIVSRTLSSAGGLTMTAAGVAAAGAATPMNRGGAVAAGSEAVFGFGGSSSTATQQGLARAVTDSSSSRSRAESSFVGSSTTTNPGKSTPVGAQPSPSSSAPPSSAQVPFNITTPTAGSLLGVSVQSVRYGRTNISVLFNLYFPASATLTPQQQQASLPPQVTYRPIRFLMATDSPETENARTLAYECVAERLVHPKDTEKLVQLLTVALAPYLSAPHVFGLECIVSASNNGAPTASGGSGTISKSGSSGNLSGGLVRNRAASSSGSLVSSGPPTAFLGAGPGGSLVHSFSYQSFPGSFHGLGASLLPIAQPGSSATVGFPSGIPRPPSSSFDAAATTTTATTSSNNTGTLQRASSAPALAGVAGGTGAEEDHDHDTASSAAEPASGDAGDEKKDVGEGGADNSGIVRPNPVRAAATNGNANASPTPASHQPLQYHHFQYPPYWHQLSPQQQQQHILLLQQQLHQHHQQAQQGQQGGPYYYPFGFDQAYYQQQQQKQYTALDQKTSNGRPKSFGSALGVRGNGGNTKPGEDHEDDEQDGGHDEDEDQHEDEDDGEGDDEEDDDDHTQHESASRFAGPDDDEEEDAGDDDDEDLGDQSDYDDEDEDDDEEDEDEAVDDEEDVEDGGHEEDSNGLDGEHLEANTHASSRTKGATRVASKRSTNTAARAADAASKAGSRKSKGSTKTAASASTKGKNSSVAATANAAAAALRGSGSASGAASVNGGAGVDQPSQSRTRKRFQTGGSTGSVTGRSIATSTTAAAAPTGSGGGATTAGSSSSSTTLSPPETRAASSKKKESTHDSAAAVNGGGVAGNKAGSKGNSRNKKKSIVSEGGVGTKRGAKAGVGAGKQVNGRRQPSSSAGAASELILPGGIPPNAGGIPYSIMLVPSPTGQGLVPVPVPIPMPTGPYYYSPHPAHQSPSLSIPSNPNQYPLVQPYGSSPLPSHPGLPHQKVLAAQQQQHPHQHPHVAPVASSATTIHHQHPPAAPVSSNDTHSSNAAGPVVVAPVRHSQNESGASSASSAFTSSGTTTLVHNLTASSSSSASLGSSASTAPGGTIAASSSTGGDASAGEQKAEQS